jgi:glycosyltransferase involved in cell wall biosynthesis
MKKLSVITVCLNAEVSIETTIMSVVGQTFTDFEYIIVDGGSKDKTLDIVDKYKENISKIVSEPDKGLYDAMNKGISLADGEYIAFLNAGDYYCNKKILEKIFGNKIEEDLIYGDMVVLLSGGTMIRKKSPKRIKKYYMFSDSLPHPATIAKRDLLINYGLFDISYKYAADFDFFLNSIYRQKCRIKYLGFPFAVFNYWGLSSSSENQKESNAERDRVLKKYFTQQDISRLNLLKPFIYIFTKYLRYGWYLVLSKLSVSYLKMKE